MIGRKLAALLSLISNATWKEKYMTIAGSDSGWGASSQANLKAFSTMELYGGSTIRARSWLQTDMTNGLMVSGGRGPVHRFYAVWR